MEFDSREDAWGADATSFATTNLAYDVRENRGVLVPIVGKLGQHGALVGRDGSLGLRGEVNPAATVRTLASEANIAPPGPYQGVVNGRP